MKYYFEKNTLGEKCYYQLSYWQKERSNREEDIILGEAKIEYGADYFYCSIAAEPGLKGQSDCGRLCEGYMPRNGKSGRCCFSKNCYEPTDKKFRLTEKGKLIKLTEGE